MAKTSFLCLLLLLSISCTSSVTTAKKSHFIKTSCGFTSYPDLCFESLSVFRSTIQQSPRLIVRTALRLSLSRAKSVRSYVSMMTIAKGITDRDVQDVNTCVDLMHDSVYNLRESVDEFRKMSEGNNTASDIRWSISNIDTWVNAAATDGSNCIDLFTGYEKNTNYGVGIRRKVTGTIQLIDNALALFEHFFPGDQY